ncbi:hypothetical protein CMT52_18620 [Elizabethkingia anophelis]|nr:hypothetical protein [Elizabethkingia anophelis]
MGTHFGYSKEFQNRNKFKAVKQKVDGYTFDSKKEASYYLQLQWREKAGEIKEIIKQKSIELYCNGTPICKYLVDFCVVTTDDEVELHEVKGFETRDWLLKWKLTEAQLEDIGKRQFNGRIPKLILIK